MNTQTLTSAKRQALLKAFQAAPQRAILLDYDGTLVPFSNKPDNAAPDKDLLQLLRQLGLPQKNNVVIISGRSKSTLKKWFGTLPIDLVAEHGAWIHLHTSSAHSLGNSCFSKTSFWSPREKLDNHWKEGLILLLARLTNKTPGSFVEEKDYSLAWHYRTCNQQLAQQNLQKVQHALDSKLFHQNLDFMMGNKVFEIKPHSINKGCAAARWLHNPVFKFLLVAGDDTTDEDMFNVAPHNAWTIHIGNQVSKACFTLKNYQEMRNLLKELARA